MEKSEPGSFLKYLNQTYVKLHKKYEELFWVSYMGDHSVDAEMNRALAARDAFRANSNLSTQVNKLLKSAKGADGQKLKDWQLFFSKYQTPVELLELKNKISSMETKIREKRSKRKEGYKDPKTGKFILASENKMRMIMRSDPHEKVRKACFEACENLALTAINEYIELVRLLNQYAKKLGYSDFYAYKIHTEEGMTKKQLFDIFDRIYEKTKYAFVDIKKMEKQMPGLRKPWNSSFMLSGDFSKESDPYFNLEDALIYWGMAFAGLGIDFKNGRLQLDLLDRKGKWNNGFCHYPDIVWYDGKKRHNGSANFTANCVYGQVGSGEQALETLFHEGGHAADRLNSEQSESAMNTEYPPASTAWAESQSMFMDSISSSIEWRTRYARDKNGNLYPFELFEREVRKLYKLNPLWMMGVMFVMNFERRIYESKKLSREKVVEIANWAYKKYTDRSERSLSILNVPHIYGWESICSYHGYGLAELCVAQRREYFYKKYGYIVDNRKVGIELTKAWQLGSSKTFAQFVKITTGRPLSAQPYINVVTRNDKQIIEQAKKRIAALKKVPKFTAKINLHAKIRMVSGKKLIADNSKGFEAMAKKYSAWLKQFN